MTNPHCAGCRPVRTDNNDALQIKDKRRRLMNVIRNTLLAAVTATSLLGSAWADTTGAAGSSATSATSATLATAGASGASGTPAFKPEVGQAGKDVVWVPTPQSLVDAMLDMAGLTPDDYLFDLGSGDGRTVITAAKRGARAHGIEYNHDMVVVSKRAADAAGVADQATFEQGDIFESDFSDATVISLFLLPNLNLKLRPTILDMAPGTRVVSNSFDMSDWEPDDKVRVDEADCNAYCRGYLWIVPAKVEGSWNLDDGATLALNQKFQMLEGSLTQGGVSAMLTNARMNGTEIRFDAGGVTYTGTVDGNRMAGTTDEGDSWSATRG